MRIMTSQARAVMSRRRDFVNYATMTLSNGTVLNLTPSDFRINGNEFTDDLVDGDTFQIGTVLGKSVTIRLDNTDGRFSSYDFYKAYFFLDIHLLDANLTGTTYSDEVLRIGKFTVLDPVANNTIIDISAVDEMYKFDLSFDNCNLDFSTPKTLYQILVKCCNDCGVAIGFTGFDNQNLTISKKPDGVTYRQVVSYICQMACTNAKIDGNGALKLGWYDMSPLNVEGLDGGTFSYPGTVHYEDGDTADGGSFNPWDTGYVFDGGSFSDNLGFHNLVYCKNVNVATDDIKITGVKVTFDETVKSYGTSAYVLEIKDNPFVAGKENTIASYLYNKLKDFTFRPFSCAYLQDPSIEAGDCALLWDSKGNAYKTIITNVRFSMNGFMDISCNATSPTNQSSVYKSAAAQAVVQARRNSQKQVDSYSQTVSHFNDLANAALGYYKTERTESGATVTYIHDRATLQTSTIIWKITATGIFISEDGGATYTAGFDASTATMLMNLVYAVGIKCDWIHTGTLKLGGDNNVNGLMEVYPATGNTPIGKWDVNGITINAGSIQIKKNNVVNFEVTSTGELTANEGTFKGTVKAGTVESNSFTDATGNFSASGIKIDLSNTGSIKAVNFALDGSGNVYLKNGSIQSNTFTENNPATNFSASGIKISLSGSGSIKAVNFAIDGNGDAYFKGNVISTGTLMGGAVQSNTYTDATGNFSSAGVKIGLDNAGYIKSKNFAIDSFGNAYFKGTIEGSTITGSTFRFGEPSPGTKYATMGWESVPGVSDAYRLFIKANASQTIRLESGSSSISLYGSYSQIDGNLYLSNDAYVFGNITIPEGGSYYTGATGSVTWVDALGTGHYITVKKGIIVSMGTT